MLNYDYYIQRTVLNVLQKVIKDFMCFFMLSKCIILLHYYFYCRIFIDILLYININLMMIYVKCIIIQKKDMKFMKNLIKNFNVMFFKD